jgi:lipopolysaccharide transport system ATP-binding protein
MSKVVLKVENISKQYRLGQLGTGTISHDLNRWFHKVRGWEMLMIEVMPMVVNMYGH